MIVNPPRKTSLVLLVVAIFLSSITFGQKPGYRKVVSDEKNLAANCTPPVAQTNLAVNNVRALITTNGLLWFDGGSVGNYEVPKGSNISAMYAGSLWLGGLDVNGQLKVAAEHWQTNGSDYWTGPISQGAAEIEAATCRTYDVHFPVNKLEIQTFNSWYEAGLFDLENGTTTQVDNFPGYTVPDILEKWPAHGNLANNEEWLLAPFFDRDGDNFYDPNNGDYPWYDLTKQLDCRTDRLVTLFGDFTLWWVNNDKGNVHTQTNGDPLGMEIRSQAFSFSTNDEVNNMTFYNYELINRGTQTLTQTYFSQWVDCDIGGYDDDFVGCDVTRGLGYAYNGNAFDATILGANGYGADPPSIAVDFFQGPYQDDDGIDNAIGTGFNEALNGVGYGDGIPDNERFGMRRFLYFNRNGSGPSPLQSPQTSTQYYDYLRGIWKDGSKMVYGGNGHNSDPDASAGITADFMFPGDTDQEFYWGTMGTAVPVWTEESVQNQPGDRNFMQSAGPFTLEPGNVNNITVGIVYARVAGGGAFASVEAVRFADDKAQALFDNCFEVLDGPDAPDLSFQELDKQLICTISNRKASNNYQERYSQIDPFIPNGETQTVQTYELDTASGQWVQSDVTTTTTFHRSFDFQGYQVFQLRDGTVTPSELNDPDRARLAFQCDLKDTIVQIVNYTYSIELGGNMPEEMVDGNNEGISHTFVINTDLFAEGDRTLINHKSYYFMALSYAYNNFKKFDPQFAQHLDGQSKPYLASRKAVSGGIPTYGAIPHITSPEANGTKLNSSYGDGPLITRIEGKGNGGIALDFTDQTESDILKFGAVLTPEYKGNHGPIDVKVIDPILLVPNDFELRLLRDTVLSELHKGTWELTDLTTGTVYASDKSIEIRYEQVFPELGFSVSIEQQAYVKSGSYLYAPPVESSLEYVDSTKNWLDGIVDVDGAIPANWIRSGTTVFDDDLTTPNIDESIYSDLVGVDDDQTYETMIDGTWAPFRLVGNAPHQPIAADQAVLRGLQSNKLALVPSVDVVITPDQSKWSRCPVVEMQEESVLAEGGAKKLELRKAASVGKDGLPDGTGTGMGWFPGYAINLETGERLNMAFGEDSWLAGENGRDMIWNPTARRSAINQVLFGGKHYVYVFRNDTHNNPSYMPAYDAGATMYAKLATGNAVVAREAWRGCVWVGTPLLRDGSTFLSSEVRVRLRVSKEYESYNTGTNLNNTDPLYTFSMKDLAPTIGDKVVAADALDLINIVPNPYYAYSRYEANRIDNRVKITNLPPTCTISIYSTSGTLVRQFRKDNSFTSVDWDLKNGSGIPIAGGIYIYHVNIPGVGEKVGKWFGVLRPTDLENF